LKEGSSKTQWNRRYLPQDLEGYLSGPRAHRSIFPPSSRTRKRLETSSQMIHLGGSSSIFFLVIALLCFLGLIFFAQKANAGAITITGGSSSYPNQRKIAVTSDGYWAFFYSDDLSDVGWSWSEKGINWTGPEKVFDGTSASDYTSYISIWQDNSDPSIVYIIVGPSIEDSGSVHMRKGTLNSNGTISWSQYAAVGGSTYLNRNPSANNRENLLGGFPASITQSSDDRLWIAAFGGEGSNGGNDDYVTIYAKANSANSILLSAWPTGHRKVGNDQDSGYSSDDDYINGVWAVPHGGGGGRVWIAGPDDDRANRWMIVPENDNTPNIEVPEDSPNLFIDNTGTTRTMLRNESAVVDSSGNLHLLHVDELSRIRYVRRDSSDGNRTSFVLDSVQEDSPSNARDATIGLGKAANGLPDRLYVVYKSTSGALYLMEGSISTTQASDWTTPVKIMEADYPVFTYSVERPNPLPLLFTEAGNVCFYKVITSTFSGPSITSISPPSSLFNSKVSTITVTGSGFRDFGIGIAAKFVLASDTNTVPSPTEIKITDTNYISPNQLEITYEIGQIPTGQGQYKIVVENPDGQSSPASTDTFTIPAPVITTISPVSGGQTAQRTITINGSNFQIWGSTKPTVSFGAGVTFSSCTYISSSQIQATINILEDATGDTRNVQLINSDGQFSNILFDSFTVTAPQVSISTPAADGDVDIQSQLLDISGTAWIVPSTPATTLGAEARIRRQSDNYCWNGVAFEEELSGEFWNDANGTDWTYPSTTWDDQQDGETYIIQARGRSSDGGRGYQKVERTVKLDANNPTLAISDPVDVKKNKQTSIKGQASDSASGISGANKIEIWIKDLTLGSTYWNGSVWISTTTEQWLQVTTYVDPNWVYTVSYPTACWTDGHQYEIGAQAWDRVDHLGSLASTQKFWYDVIAPTATLTMPEDGKWYTSMNEINGSVTDNTLDRDPKGTVWLKVQNQTNNQYLTQASTWTSSATPIWIQTNFRGTGKTREWYFDTSVVVWANMVDYEVEVYAEDGAVGQPSGPNEQAPPWPTATFTYDASVPESTITSPVADRIYSSAPSLTGTALDEYDKVLEGRYRI